MSLRNKIIRLAYEKPELRDQLLPLVEKTAMNPRTRGHHYSPRNNYWYIVYGSGKVYTIGTTFNESQAKSTALFSAVKVRENGDKAIGVFFPMEYDFDNHIQMRKNIRFLNLASNHLDRKQKQIFDKYVEWTQQYFAERRDRLGLDRLANKTSGAEIVYYAVHNKKTNQVYYFGATKSQRGAIRVAEKKNNALTNGIYDTQKMNDKKEIIDWCEMRADLSMHEAQILMSKPSANDISISWIYDDAGSVTNAKKVANLDPFFLSRKDKGLWRKFKTWVSGRFK